MKLNRGARGRALAVVAVLVLTACLTVPPDTYALTLSTPSSSQGEEDSGGSDDASTEEQAEASDSKSEAKQKLDGLKDDYENLQKELDAIKQNIDNITSEKEKTVARKNSVSRQISISEQQLAILQQRITVINETIAQKEQEIADKQADIDENYELFKVRMRALYMTDTSSVMNVLFGTQSFSEFLERSEYIKRMTEHDDNLIKRLRQDKADIEAAKAEVDAAKVELDAAKAEESTKKKQLEQQYSTLSTEVSLLKKTEAEYNANKASIQKQLDESKAEIDKLMAELSSSGEFVGGEFGWPLPGYSQISSAYGWRFNNSDFHTGIDITGSGVRGSSVKASNGGEVAYAKTTYTQGVGYGKYVIINHGGGYATLYAHMDSVSVSLGDTVSKGDEVGKVGSTGWSTGPHLHFEIRKDSHHTNPMNYFTKK